MSEQKQQTVQELINQADSEADKAQTNAITISTNCRKALAIQLVNFAELSSKQSVEIRRLQELLRQNNIQFILPVEPVKLSKNKAIVPEPQLETPSTTKL